MAKSKTTSAWDALSASFDDDGFLDTKVQGAMDTISGSLTTISNAHHLIHDGVTFFVTHVDDSPPTNIADQSMIAFKTHATTKIHMLYRGTASAAAEFQVWEGPSAGAAGGTEVSVLNRDRDSATASTMRGARVLTAAKVTTYVIADSGNVTGGTIIYREQMGASGQGLMTTGGNTRDVGEMILKSDTVYAFVVESLDVNDNIHQIYLTWYERV